MKHVRLKVFMIVTILGLALISTIDPQQSEAYRTDTLTPEINFNMKMDNGSLIPSGKVPTATVNFGLGRYDVQTGDFPVTDNVLLNDYINEETITIPYDGAGNFSYTHSPESITYGMRLRIGPPYARRATDMYLSFYNLKFSDVPKYIRTISSKSSVYSIGDHSTYVRTHDRHESPVNNENSVFTARPTGEYAINNPDLTRTAPGSFKYNGHYAVSGKEHPESVEFAFSGGLGRFHGGLTNWLDEKHYTSSLASSGKRITFFLKPFEVSGRFVDQAGASLSPPTGFTNSNSKTADSEMFTYTMNKVPTSYVASDGYLYTLQGWYGGLVKPATLETSNPPSMTVDYTQPKSILELAQDSSLRVVYAKSFAVNEKYVDDSNASINGGAWDTTVPTVISSTFNGAPAATKTDSSNAEWEYVGWKIGLGGTVSSSPVTIASVSGNEDIYYIYKRSSTTASLDLTPTPQIVNSGDPISWSSRLTNTGAAPLNNLKIKATSNWAAGLSHPTQVTVTPAGGSPVNFTVGAGDWASGVDLTGISIPNGGANNYADITFTDTATGAVNQVLPAEIEVAGNIPAPIKADNFVRIDDPDEPNLKPSGTAGLINLPDFRFGEVEVKPYAQKKGLDAASYRSGYNPYIRYFDQESTGMYSLSVKMSPFISGSKTLPSTTSIKLGDGTMKEVQNYNKHNESLSAGSTISEIRILSDNTTSFVHFDITRGVYQIEYAFNEVELDLMAHSGVAGLSYTSTMDWTLTTAP